MSLISRICTSLLLCAAPVSAYAATDYRNFMVGNYEEIVVEGDIVVEIVNNSAPSARAEGDPALVDAVQFETMDKVLRFKLIQPSIPGYKAPVGQLKIKLTGRNIRKLSLRGTGKISIDTVKTVLGQFDVHGPGEIQIGNLQAEKVQVLLNGPGRVRFDGGSTKSGALHLNGTGNFEGPQFDFGTLTLFQMGAATTNTLASRDVTITNNGPGSITIGGSGSCIIRQAGSGTITCPNKGGVK